GVVADGKRATGGAVIATAAIANRRVPKILAGAGVKRADVGVGGGENNLVLIHGDAAHGGGSGVGAVIVLPNQVAGLGVESLQNISGVVEIHHSVMHQRSRLIGAAI